MNFAREVLGSTFCQNFGASTVNISTIGVIQFLFLRNKMLFCAVDMFYVVFDLLYLEVKMFLQL